MDKDRIAAIAAPGETQRHNLSVRALYRRSLRLSACVRIVSGGELRDSEINALIGKKAVARNDQEAMRNALYCAP